MSKNNKLWEGHRMILPEYREKVFLMDEERITKPCLDAEAYEKIEAGIKAALAGGGIVKVSIWAPKDKAVREKVGQIVGIVGSNEIKFLTRDKRLKIPLGNILAVEPYS